MQPPHPVPILVLAAARGAISKFRCQDKGRRTFDIAELIDSLFDALTDSAFGYVLQWSSNVAQEKDLLAHMTRADLSVIV